MTDTPPAIPATVREVIMNHDGAVPNDTLSTTVAERCDAEPLAVNATINRMERIGEIYHVSERGWRVTKP